jgi:hypothetical protein
MPADGMSGCRDNADLGTSWCDSSLSAYLNRYAEARGCKDEATAAYVL